MSAPPAATCGTCTHWDRDRNDYKQVVQVDWQARLADAEQDAREEATHEMDRLYGYCKAVPMGPAYDNEPLPLALAMDGSEYKADLLTRAEFGCVLHEPKVTTP